MRIVDDRLLPSPSSTPFLSLVVVESSKLLFESPDLLMSSSMRGVGDLDCRLSLASDLSSGRFLSLGVFVASFDCWTTGVAFCFVLIATC